MILKEDVSRRYVIWKIGKYDDFRILKEIPKDEAEWVPYQVFWVTKDGSGTLKYVEDHVHQVHYLLAQAPDPESIAVKLRRILRVYTSEELVALFQQAQTAEERRKAVTYLMVGAPGHSDPTFLALIKEALANPEPALRVYALEVASYVTWPDLKPVLQAMSETDPDADVRTGAASLLRTWPAADAGS